MDGFVFNESKPIKDFKEGWQKTKAALSGVGKDISTETNYAQTKVKEANLGSKFKSLWGRVTGKKEETKQEEPAPK